MGFLLPDDYVVLMDMCPFMGVESRHLNDYELDLLSSAGCKTLLEYVPWEDIERVYGQYDWSHIDAYIMRARAHGFKVILSTPHYVPACFPTDWYPWDAQGNPMVSNIGPVPRGVISLFNLGAIEHYYRFLRECVMRYAAPDVFLFSSQQVEGETLYQNGYSFNDPGAQESFKRYAGSDAKLELGTPAVTDWLRCSYLNRMAEIQTIFLHKQDELWSALHPILSGRYGLGLIGNGCEYLEDLWHLYQVTWPNVHKTWLQYTYWPHGDEYRAIIKRLAQLYGVNDIIGGAEWIEGLTPNSRLCERWGVRSLLLGIIHPYSGHHEVTPEMAETVRSAIQYFKSREGIVIN